MHMIDESTFLEFIKSRSYEQVRTLDTCHRITKKNCDTHESTSKFKCISRVSRLFLLWHTVAR